MLLIFRSYKIQYLRCCRFWWDWTRPRCLCRRTIDDRCVWTPWDWVCGRNSHWWCREHLPLLSDVQRDANEIRKDVRSVLIDCLHQNKPVAWQYGSVQRTDRRNWTLVDDKQILEVHEKAGTDRECVTSTDSSKTDEVLKAIEVSESEFFDIGKSEYIWKIEVHDEQKEVACRGRKTNSPLPDVKMLRNMVGIECSLHRNMVGATRRSNPILLPNLNNLFYSNFKQDTPDLGKICGAGLL